MNEKTKLKSICNECVERCIIYKYEERNGHFRIDPVTGGNKTILNFLIGQFEKLGYTVQHDSFGKLNIYYNTFESIEKIKEVFEGY